MNEDFPSEFEKPEQSPGFLLWQVSNEWQRKQREALSTVGLTHVQFVLLASIHWLEAQGAVTQSALASHANTDPMMTSQVVRTLQNKGLIVRSPHPEDSRALQLVTTALGRKSFEEAIVIVEGVDRDYFEVLGKNRDKFTSFLGMLSKNSRG